MSDNKLVIQHNYVTWSVEATQYGVDVFKNGGYLFTKQTEEKISVKHWIRIGVEEVMHLIAKEG